MSKRDRIIRPERGSPDSVVNAFDEISTSGKRYEAIWALFGRFTQEEVDQLRRWSQVGVFHRDPIHALPVELVSQIFQLVDLRTAFRCHRVSKDWRKLLSSYEIIQGLFHSWFCCGTHATLYSRDTPAPAASAMAAHIDAFRTGDPFAMTKIVLQSYTRSDYAAAYYGGLLVWSVDMSYTTNLRCLRTGRTKLWVNQGRSKTHCIAVSELLVATCDHFGNVSVHNHLTDDEYIFKLSSANVKGFALRSTTLAILLDHNVLVWSLETQKTRQIPVLLEGGIGEMWDRFQLQFTANGEDIIYSHTFVDDSSAGKVTFSRVPLDGAPQETSTVHEITSSGESICRKTCQRTPSKLHTFGIMNYNDEAILISYDEFRNQPQFHVLGRSHSLWPQTGYLEKHVLYKSAIVKQGGSRKLLVKDLHSHRDQHNATWKPTHMDGAKFTSRIDGQYEVLGDETFLVHMFDTHIAAYCFDQHSQGGHSWTKLRPLPVTNKK